MVVMVAMRAMVMMPRRPLLVHMDFVVVATDDDARVTAVVVMVSVRLRGTIDVNMFVTPSDDHVDSLLRRVVNCMDALARSVNPRVCAGGGECL